MGGPRIASKSYSFLSTFLASSASGSMGKKSSAANEESEQSKQEALNMAQTFLRRSKPLTRAESFVRGRDNGDADEYDMSNLTSERPGKRGLSLSQHREKDASTAEKGGQTCHTHFRVTLQERKQQYW